MVFLRFALPRTFLASLRSLCLAGLALGGALPAQAGGHEAVSADAAAQALLGGASIVDVRSAIAFEQGHLPGAVHLAYDAADQSLATLQRLVSDAGADLSRTVLVVGEPGDTRAQALWTALSDYASGRVLWLVGGALEWQMGGRALSTHRVAVKAVPQHLVRLQGAPTKARMAGQGLRDTNSASNPAAAPATNPAPSLGLVSASNTAIAQ